MRLIKWLQFVRLHIVHRLKTHKMEMTTLIIVGVIVLIAIITIIGILSRYRKCKSDELLVVYGKTGSHKEKVNELDAKGNQVSREVEIKTARVYHGGSA